MARTWDAAAPGVLQLPSGRLVRGRRLQRLLPIDALPEFGLYLLGRPPAPMAWESRRVHLPDIRLPTDQDDARDSAIGYWHAPRADPFWRWRELAWASASCGGGAVRR